jgi:hypothetical protein
MSGRLSGLKDALKAERSPPGREAPAKAAESPEAVPQRSSTRAKARMGKRAVVGYFSPELARTLNVMATERDTTLQAILGEAIDLWLRENGKHPFGER